METIHYAQLMSARIRWEPAVLLSVIVGTTTMLCPNVQADNTAYSFKKVAELGGQAPNGGVHINDFEPGALNNRGMSSTGPISEPVATLQRSLVKEFFCAVPDINRNLSSRAVPEMRQAAGSSIFFCLARLK